MSLSRLRSVVPRDLDFLSVPAQLKVLNEVVLDLMVKLMVEITSTTINVETLEDVDVEVQAMPARVHHEDEVHQLDHVMSATQHCSSRSERNLLCLMRGNLILSFFFIACTVAFASAF